MGYTKDGSITNYWPDNDDKTAYFDGSIDLMDLISAIQVKWPDRSLTEFTISAENIHTHCLTYDQHCASDHTDFIIVTLKDPQ